MMAPRDVRPCGAVGLADSSVRWWVWAPQATKVEIILHTGGGRSVYPMTREPRGHFSHTQPAIAEGQRYAYRLSGAASVSIWPYAGNPIVSTMRLRSFGQRPVPGLITPRGAHHGKTWCFTNSMWEPSRPKALSRRLFRGSRLDVSWA